MAAIFKADTDDAEIQRPPRFDRQQKNPDETVNAFIPKPDLDSRIQKVKFSDHMIPLKPIESVR